MTLNMAFSCAIFLEYTLMHDVMVVWTPFTRRSTEAHRFDPGLSSPPGALVLKKQGIGPNRVKSLTPNDPRPRTHTPIYINLKLSPSLIH